MCKDKILGRIHSIETCGAVDGPGIRYVIFFQGCPLRCKYCHNPDTWDLYSNNAKEMTVKDIFEDIIRYKNFMLFSNGGITATGGEPLMQANFVANLFELCKSENIHTALDTSGFVKIENALNVLKNTDLVLLDIKSYNNYTFKNITGRNLDLTIKFANYLSENNILTWIRFVLVPNLSDNIDEIKNLAQYISTLKNIEKVEVLPFHKMGEYKWKSMGIDYTLNHTNPPSNENLNEVKNIFKKYNLNVD